MKPILAQTLQESIPSSSSESNPDGTLALFVMMLVGLVIFMLCTRQRPNAPEPEIDTDNDDDSLW